MHPVLLIFHAILADRNLSAGFLFYLQGEQQLTMNFKLLSYV